MSFINKKEYESLALHNSFNTGGKCRYFISLQNKEELEEVLFWNKNNENLSIYIIGQGKNIIFNDTFLNAIIITFNPKQPTHSYIDQNIGLLSLSSGISLKESISYAIEHNLFGLEEFSGIPSSIGGAVATNIHYFDQSIANFLNSAEIYDTQANKVYTVDNKWFEFAPYESRLKREKKYILISATFLLQKKDNAYKEYAKGRSYEIIRHRKYRYSENNNCGLFFKHFLESEVPLINNKKERTAAFYISQCNLLTGPKYNNTFLSSQNPNIITHNGKGTSKEIITIARFLQEIVFKKFKLVLTTDCHCIGFKNYPLHTKETLEKII